MRGYAYFGQYNELTCLLDTCNKCKKNLITRKGIFLGTH